MTPPRSQSVCVMLGCGIFFESCRVNRALDTMPTLFSDFEPSYFLTFSIKLKSFVIWEPLFSSVCVDTQDFSPSLLGTLPIHRCIIFFRFLHDPQGRGAAFESSFGIGRSPGFGRFACAAYCCTALCLLWCTSALPHYSPCRCAHVVCGFLFLVWSVCGSGYRPALLDSWRGRETSTLGLHFLAVRVAFVLSGQESTQFFVGQLFLFVGGWSKR